MWRLPLHAVFLALDSSCGALSSDHPALVLVCVTAQTSSRLLQPKPFANSFSCGWLSAHNPIAMCVYIRIMAAGIKTPAFPPACYMTSGRNGPHYDESESNVLPKSDRFASSGANAGISGGG